MFHVEHVLLGLCPTRAEGESTTSGSKPRRFDRLLHKAFPLGLR